MFNLKKEKIKKNLFLALALISAFIFVAGTMCAIMGENSPIKLIIGESPIKLIVPPALVFFITFALYRNSKKAIEENSKRNR